MSELRTKLNDGYKSVARYQAPVAGVGVVCGFAEGFSLEPLPSHPCQCHCSLDRVTPCDVWGETRSGLYLKKTWLGREVSAAAPSPVPMCVCTMLSRLQPHCQQSQAWPQGQKGREIWASLEMRWQDRVGGTQLGPSPYPACSRDRGCWAVNPAHA